jgi:hypothetical protein
MILRNFDNLKRISIKIIKTLRYLGFKPKPNFVYKVIPEKGGI